MARIIAGKKATASIVREQGTISIQEVEVDKCSDRRSRTGREKYKPSLRFSLRPGFKWVLRFENSRRQQFPQPQIGAVAQVFP